MLWLIGLLAALLVLGLSNIKTAYGTTANLTITLASLATSSTWLAGREATLVDNTSDLYLDFHLAGKVTVGTTPTSGTEIRVYVVSLMDDSTWPDVFDGTDSAETVTSAGVGSGFLKLAAVMLVDATTSDRAYYFDAGSVRGLFNGVLPKKWTVFVAHNTGVNLNATGGNHQITVFPEYATSS